VLGTGRPALVSSSASGSRVPGAHDSVRMGRVRVRPVTPSRLVSELAEAIAARGGAPWLRAAVDGAPPTRPGELADALVDELRLRARPVLRVSAADHLRPASLRLERGRPDAPAFYDGWLDAGALAREVLDPAGPGGSGQVLPALWDVAADRARRCERVRLPPGGVVLVDGELLLGRGLALDVTVHLALSEAALHRRIDPSLRWTLPAYARYAAEVDPVGIADHVVRLDDPRRPALQAP